MGYRSDVAYTIRFRRKEDYHLFILEAKANPTIAGSLEECICDERRMRIDFKAESVKWYESYPDVDMHENLIDQAQAWLDGDTHVAIKDGETEVNLIEHRLAYIFIRIGEATDDITHREGGDTDYTWLHVSRTIEGDIPA